MSDMQERSSQLDDLQAWALVWQDVADRLQVTPDEGLGPQVVEERRQRYGPNRLRSAQSKSAWQILIEQFESLIVGLLAVAAILSFAFGEWIEGVAVVVVILINATIGFVTELRAVRSMEALQEMTSVEAKVRRQGSPQVVPAEKLLPGDVVLLSGGDVVTADLRLLEASKLQVSEAALTGESVPVDKQVDVIEEDVPLAERSNMAFKGTAVTRGAGEGIVVATGMDTELGHISSLVEQAEQEATPLEKRLEQLGHRLIWVTLAIAALVIAAGVLAGKGVLLMVETGVALAVASVPEGLPIVATVALARGMWRMAKRNALINRLSAVETLGATNVILTDKTGTLTENQMTVVRLALAENEIQIEGEGLETEGRFTHQDAAIDPMEKETLQMMLQVGLLCSDASLEVQNDSNGGEPTAVGDPLEVALLVAGAKADLTRDQLLEQKPEVREVAFDPDLKMMATFHQENGHYRVAVKGALESVVEASSRVSTLQGERELTEEAREAWLERNDRMARSGLRVLALATKQVDDAQVDPYRGLNLLGLVGLLDPPREEVQPAIQSAKQAGVRIVMVTGDQSATATNVAQAVGLVESEDVDAVHGADLKALEDASQEEQQRALDAPIFARVSPKQKLDLIALHQETGAVVAMTGDGVNDAPALKKADIGVAMGQRGTQVAREAADMVLKDDAFSTIVVAIEQGRVIFNNIRRFVLYLLSCNVAEVMVVALASLVNAPLPITPLQILFLNLVTDVFPALALGVGEGDPAIMARPPRDPDEPIMMEQHWLAVGGYGAIITSAVLGAFAIAFTQTKGDQAVTISFLTLALAQLWHVFNMRDRDSGVVQNDIVQNLYVWGALVLCVGLLLVAVYVPVLANVLSTTDPGAFGWALALGMSLIPLLIGQVLKALDVV